MPRHVQAGFHGGMNARLMAGFKQRGGHFRVHKGFAAGKGDATAAAIVKRLIAQDGRHDLRNLFCFAANAQGLRRAAVCQRIKAFIIKTLTVNEQTIQRPAYHLRRGLLA